MPKFEHSFTVEAPLEQVAAFHKDTRVLKWLTPPPVIVQLHRFDPMGEGAVARFTLWMGPLPLRWVAVHNGVDPLRGFTDTQVEGPFKFWRHRHIFVAEGESLSRVNDQVEYEHHPGWRGLLTRLLFPPSLFPVMFTYRKWATRAIVERD